jgi:nitroimidazol reductase NimA-like FMN-containing flavoprotein (pyridoxamine 5'-phosphate oxidase superfamily)
MALTRYTLAFYYLRKAKLLININLCSYSTTRYRVECKMKIVRLPKMNEQEIQQLLEQQMLCRIAFKAEKYPYMAPFQYVLINDTLFFHFTNYGRKMDLIDKDDRVCVEIESCNTDLNNYNFVVLRGNLKVVDDPEERAMAIKKMAKEGKKNLSENFLAAHGIKKDEGWEAFSQKKPFVIVKLHKIIEKIGLKSPN